MNEFLTRQCGSDHCKNMVPESQRYCPPCIDEYLEMKNPDYVICDYSLSNKPATPSEQPECPLNVTAKDILEMAGKHMQDRAATYDKPTGERSIPATIDAFNAITGHNITHEQGWLLMVLLKAVRTQQGEYKADNYEDMAAYAALQGEQAAAEAKYEAEFYNNKAEAFSRC